MARAARNRIFCARQFATSVLLLSQLGLVFLAVSCGKETKITPPSDENNPPRVDRILVSAARPHAAEDILVSVVADDVDGDRLSYRWTSSSGAFPNGPGNRGVLWSTPRRRIVDTLSVLVYDYEDSVTIFLPVPLVLPLGPDSIYTVAHRNEIDVVWRDSPDNTVQNWSGYDVYMGTSSLKGLTHEQLLPFQINTEPVAPDVDDKRIFRALGLVSGQKYFFDVRGRRDYDSTTEISDFIIEADAAPRPQGVLSFFPEIQSASPVAFDFSSGGIRAINVAEPDQVSNKDIYIGTDTPEDTGHLDLVCKSVSKLSYGNAAWADRVVKIKPLGFDFDVSSTDDSGWETQVTLEDGGVYAVLTPEGNYGKFQVTRQDGFYPNRKIWIRWAYQSLSGYARF